MKNKTLPYPILTISPNIALLQLPNENTCLHIFSHFKRFHPSALNKRTFKVQTMVFQAKLPSHYVFQSHTVWS